MKVHVTSPAPLPCKQDIPDKVSKSKLVIRPFCEVDLIDPVQPVVGTGMTDPALGDGATKTGIANTFMVKQRTSLVTSAESVAVKQYSIGVPCWPVVGTKVQVRASFTIEPQDIPVIGLAGAVRVNLTIGPLVDTPLHATVEPPVAIFNTALSTGSSTIGFGGGAMFNVTHRLPVVSPTTSVAEKQKETFDPI